MNEENDNYTAPARAPNPERSPAARRALEEAEARRLSKPDLAETPAAPREIAGRGGLEPTRYGDWEVKGIISDF